MTATTRGGAHDDADETGETLHGNVAGVVRVGQTVRRVPGPWTPAVHALLHHLARRVPHVPRVLGFDGLGREVLTYLPGRVVDVDSELLTVDQITSLVRWTRRFHEAVAGFSHPGPWRYVPIEGATLVGHNDIAPYNVCFRGDDLVGVFDWDMSGPSTPLAELAFIAWNCVPLWRDVGAALAARRLTAIASGYRGSPSGPALSAGEILRAVPGRIRVMLDGIPARAGAGDPGMANLVAGGEPERSRAPLADLVARIPVIERYLT